ncbi:membrane protein insertase YidC [bacterium]|nr:membrane protein insertase YidC [bacterium]
MEQNSKRIFAILICLCLFFIYKTTILDPYLKSKIQPQIPQSQTGQIEPASQGTQPVSATVTSSATANPTVGQTSAEAPTTKHLAPTDGEIAQVGFIRIETDDLIVTISKLGARVTSVKFKNYKETVQKNSADYEAVLHIEGQAYPLGISQGATDDRYVQYLASETEGFKISGSAEKNIAFTGNLPDGRSITKTLTFFGLGYGFNCKVQTSAPDSARNRTTLEWTKAITQASNSLLDPYDITTFNWFDGQKAFHKKVNEIEGQVFSPGNVRWVSISNKYFVSTILNLASEPTESNVAVDNHIHSLKLKGGETEGNFKLWIGPKNYSILSSAGSELQRNIDFGKVAFLSAPLLWLLNAFYKLVGNYGLAIILLTILVKLASFPLNTASFKQMKAMQDIQPEVKRLRETVKDARAQQTQLMELYRSRGVNPLGGCFPMLLQFPIFIGLYSALLLGIELRHAPFALWIQDLSAPEKLHLAGVGVPVMVLLMIASMLIQQWTMPSNMEPAQKKAMLIMPFIFGFMFASFPAGVTLYWLVSNILAITQQQGLRLHTPQVAMRWSLIASFAIIVAATIFIKIS